MTRRTGALEELEAVQKAIESVTKDIEILIDLMIQTNSAAMGDRLQAMEERKLELEEREIELDSMARVVLYSRASYTRAFEKAKKRLLEGKLEQTRDIIGQFVDRVDVYNDRNATGPNAAL